MDSGHCGLGVAIILNDNFVCHVCKISEVSGCLISVCLFFAGKASVTILGLYAGASAGVRFEQTSAVNALIASAISSSHVLFSSDFYENGARHSVSFKKCSDLGLLNAFLTGIKKTIDFIFVSNHLSSAVFGEYIGGVLDYFNTDYLAVSISVELGGFLDKQLNTLHKLKCFNEHATVNMLLLRDDFTTAKDLSNLNTMWKLLEKVLTMSADSIFSKHWYSIFDCSKNKHLSRFYWLELLIAKIIKALSVDNSLRVAHLVKIWSVLDDVESSKISGLLDTRSNSVKVFKQLSVAKKHYHKAKYVESELAKNASINKAISKYMDDFVLEKENMISSILEHPFCKVVFDHLVLDGDLILKPAEVKTKIDDIMVNWTRKYKVPESYALLDYVVDDAFSGVMNEIRLGDLCDVVKNLLDGKAAGLLGISNELWKHSSNLEGCLTNTQPIALIETVRKILSKILSDCISAACNTFDVLKGDNFSVLRSTLTQLSGTLTGIARHFHLRSSLRCIKMYNRFIKFFGNIHLNRTNRVMTDFGLSNDEVFSPLLWRIFYDSLLCEIKSQKHLCKCRIDSKLVAKSGRVESQAGMTSFFAAGAFVDDTIWVSSSQATTQCILNIASEFFALNDISINTEKTVTIPLNQRVKDISLTINGTPIAVAKKPSLLKMHSDMHFFSNVVLRKAIFDKQFCYLVSSVLQSIVSYRIQFSFILSVVCFRWDVIIRRDLKFKTHLPHDFSMAVLLYPLFYGIKTFAQVQSESKSSSVINFANALGILGLWVNLKDNFLARIVKIFSFCGLSFSILPTAFHYSIGMLISEVLGDSVFFRQLNLHGPVPVWFDLAIHFLGAHLLAANVRPCMSIDRPEYPVVTSTISKAQNILLNSGLVSFDVYIDGSVKQFGSCSVVAKAAVFFPKFGLGVDARVQGVMSSILVELKAIALTFTCVPSVWNLSFGTNNAGFYSMLAKGFVPSGWCHEALDALGCSIVAGAMAGKVIADSSVSHLMDIVRDRLNVGVVRLLSLDETRGVYSGMHTSGQVFSGMRDMVSVIANL
ncbi:hypothetical protein G9A89_014508 [Geosiphon pyriformis]|nr:hypothetical protein G9A89_014508 [Geosiphon pyriformis]